MKPSTKLTGEERRAAIIRAVRKLFSEKGFHGTTTRELAEAAGVSEALLFKHFPTKEALFEAMQISCCNQQDHAERLKALEPSASTLVLLTHFLISKMVAEAGRQDDDAAIHARLMYRSLLEDGSFARQYLVRVAEQWVPKCGECIRAAIAAGEALESPVAPSLGSWFTHHIGVMLKLYLMPPEPAVDYGTARELLVEQAVWFALRGMGLREEVIRRHYNPAGLALLSL